jgi:cholera toxin transcriptional activator
VAEKGREPRIYRFGVFELYSSTSELRKDGRTEPRLREQSLQVLLALLERPRELVTREQLRERLWSSDTFVDFDHSLNSAVNQLRNALGDSASNPRFIQTVPRKGYRFIAPLEVAPENAADSRPGGGKIAVEHFGDDPVSVLAVEPQSRPAAGGSGGRASTFLSNSEELPAVSSRIVRVLFSLIQLMYLSFYVVSLAKLAGVEAVLAASGRAAVPIWVALFVTAAVGIPVRLYLLAAAGFKYRGLAGSFLNLFPFVFPLDELWALAPFLIVGKIGAGLAIAATAALLYLPFAQRSLLLMGCLPEQK